MPSPNWQHSLSLYKSVSNILHKTSPLWKPCILLRLFQWTKKKKNIPSMKTCTHCRGGVLASEKTWGREVKPNKFVLLCLTKYSTQRQCHPTRGSCNLGGVAWSLAWAKRQALLLPILLLLVNLETKKRLPFLLRVIGSFRIISDK